MMISPATNEDSQIPAQVNEDNTDAKPSTPTPVTFGSPLTPIDEVDLSTPQEPQCRRSLFLENDEFVDALDDFLDCMYDSDGNGPPEAKEEDQFQFEEAVLAVSDGASVPVLPSEKIVIIEDSELKKMKVDTLKTELRIRGLSTSGKKAELLERLKNAMINKVPLVEESTTSLAPNGFSPTARWRLLSSTEDAEEPMNVDSTLLDPSEARDNRNKGVYDGNKDPDNERVRKVTPVVKKNYCAKFHREQFAGVALQPVISRKKGKNKRSQIKYEKQPILDLVPNMKFIDMN